MTLNKTEKLKLYSGKLKYQKQKMIFVIETIDKYIDRIEENTATVKCSEFAYDEEYKNKDLLTEVEELFKELTGGNSD